MAIKKDSFVNMTSGLFNTDVKPDVESSRTRPSTKTGLIQRAYYITDDQFKFLKLQAIENGTDASNIIRKIIDQYIEKQKS